MLFLLALTGCSKDEAGNDSDAPVPVRFEAGSPEVFKSRTEINTLSNLQSAGFGVFAYYTGATAWESAKASATPNFMYNQQVTYSSGWTYTPVKYWPNADGEKVSFFAYAPYTSNTTGFSTNTAAGAPIISYTWGTTNDLLYDKQIDQVKGTVSSAVTFTFKHALAKVEFKARRDNGTLGTITINSLSITSNGATLGTFNLSEATWSSSSADASPLTSLAESKTVPADYNETVSLGSSLMIPGNVTFTHDFSYTIQSIVKDLPATAISPITLEAGHKYTITFVISQYSVTVDTEKFTEQW